MSAAHKVSLRSVLLILGVIILAAKVPCARAQSICRNQSEQKSSPQTDSRQSPTDISLPEAGLHQAALCPRIDTSVPTDERDPHLNAALPLESTSSAAQPAPTSGKPDSPSASAQQTPDEDQPLSATTLVHPHGYLTANAVCSRNYDQEMSARIDQLINAALSNTDSTELNAMVEKYSTRAQRGRFGAKDIVLNYLGLPRGFEFSQEGARLVLNQPSAITSLESAQCVRHVYVDQWHYQICISMLQIAMGLGCEQPEESAARIEQGMKPLRQVAGSGEAAQTLDMLTDWWQNASTDQPAFLQKDWDLTDFERRSQIAGEMAARYDPFVLEYKNKLNYFAEHSKPMQLAAKAVEGAVSGLTMFGPGFGVPIAAQAAGALWGQANGGSEEAKLLKELYWQKQLDTRERILHQEASLALMNYQTAVRTKNAPLLLCSEILLAQLVGAGGIQQLLPEQAIDHHTFPNHSIAEGQINANLKPH